MSLLLMGAGASGSSAWSPGLLPDLIVTFLPAVSLAQGKIWQDASKAIPAVTHGDPVRVITCPYTGIDAVAPSDSARPLLSSEGGGKWSLLFDGADDMLTTAAVTVGNFFSAGGAFVRGVGNGNRSFAGHNTVIGTRQRMILRTTTNVANLAFSLFNEDLSATGSSLTAAPSTVLMEFGPGNAQTIRQNGTQIGSRTAGGVYAGGSAVFNVGNDAGAGLWTGRIYGVVLSGFLSSPNRTALETYLNNLWSV